MTNRLAGADPIANDTWHIAFNPLERSYLGMLLTSARTKDRRLGLRYLANSWRVRKNRSFVIEHASRLARDPKVRVEAMGVLADFAHDFPEAIWPSVVELGSHRNWHIRQQLAASALEVLMAEHHERFFSRVRLIVLSGNKRFLSTLTGCWPYGQPKEHWFETLRLVKAAGGDIRKTYDSHKYPLDEVMFETA